MIDFERGLYVRIVQRSKGPPPLPLEQGFSECCAYRVLGIYNASETGECWLILSNDRDEIWYISQRHVRTWRLQSELTQLRCPLAHNDNHAAALPALAKQGALA